jgi:Ser/Thr protein kinase RdoA (MazF antagonist)
MGDATIDLSTLLGGVGALYDAEAVTLDPLAESAPEDGVLALLAVTRRAGPLLIRAYQADRATPEPFRYFYPWTCDASGCDLAGWLRSRAATLLALEKQSYPAPALVRPATGDTIGDVGGWLTLARRYVEGEPLAPTVDQLRALGEALGALHALEPDAAAGRSYWGRDYAIPAQLARLESVEDQLPRAWADAWYQFHACATEIQAKVELPTTLIHGDAWAANALQTPNGQVTLVDWETGGLGIVLLDLGRLLLECHLDSGLPPDNALAWHIRPDVERINAVVEGYARRRRPSTAELRSLLAGVRFGVAHIGALHFSQELLTPSTDPAWVAGMRRRFERLQNRLAVSEEVADIARSHFTRLS